MGLSFFETMKGELRDRDGALHSIAFEVKAEARHLRAFFASGEARISGVVQAAPWAEDAALDGTLRIDPLRGRTISYAFRFADADARAYEFRGQKDLRWLRPLSSTTTLAGALHRGGELVAEGVLRFDLADLVPFAASWRPWSGMSREESPIASPPLSDRERYLVEAFAQALVARGARVPAPDADSLAAAEARIAGLPAPVHALFRLGLHWLDAAALRRTRRSFLDLSPSARGRLVAELGGPEAPARARRVLDLLGLPIRLAHFGQPAYLDALGFRVDAVRDGEPEPRWMRRVVAADALGAETTIEAEVVVVGTGAGGAAVAAALAERGVAVALLEEGRYHRRTAFSGEPAERMQRLWRDGGTTASVGRPPIVIPLGRLVGGTTAINSGTCLRTPDAVLQEWRRELGFPEDFAPDRFAPWLDAVEAELQVAPAASDTLGAIAGVVARGAEALGLRHGPLLRNAPGCDGQGACILGCPTGAKRSSDVSWVPRALEAGAELYTGLPVTRLLFRDGRAVAVEARGVGEDGRERVLRVHARVVVLSCGSLLTPLLLRDNGVELPWLGRNLSVHPAMGAWARCDERMTPWRAVPQGYGVDVPVDGTCFEGFYLPPPLAGAMMPRAGAELTRWMDDHDHVGQFGFLVRDEGRGRVRRGPGGRPLVMYDLSPRSLRRLREGAAWLAEILLRGGGREVMLGIGGMPSLRTLADAARLRTTPIAAADLKLLGAHPLGTCRMGAHAGVAVVDFEHRVFGTENVYVVDGGAVPTSLGVNPQLTIMAMALRAGAAIAAQLGE